MKKILVIAGHPSKESFCGALVREYAKGIKKSGNEIEILYLGELNFNPILKNGYKKLPDLEPDLAKAQKLIKWANHLTFIYPHWWASPPALLKAFIERVFLPDFAFRFTKKGFIPKWDRLLSNKSARLIVTMDSPPWHYKLIVGDPGYKMMKDILIFCGIKPVKKCYLGPMMNSSEKKRDYWLKQIYKLGLTE